MDFPRVMRCDDAILRRLGYGNRSTHRMLNKGHVGPLVLQHHKKTGKGFTII